MIFYDFPVFCMVVNPGSIILSDYDYEHIRPNCLTLLERQLLKIDFHRFLIDEMDFQRFPLD